MNNFKEAQAKSEQQPQQSFDIALQQKEFLSIDEAAKLIGASRRTIHRLANSLSILAKTAEGYITAFAKSGLVHRESQDNYINTSLEDIQDSKDAEDA